MYLADSTHAFRGHYRQPSEDYVVNIAEISRSNRTRLVVKATQADANLEFSCYRHALAAFHNRRLTSFLSALIRRRNYQVKDTTVRINDAQDQIFDISPKLKPNGFQICDLTASVSFEYLITRSGRLSAEYIGG